MSVPKHNKTSTLEAFYMFFMEVREAKYGFFAVKNTLGINIFLLKIQKIAGPGLLYFSGKLYILMLLQRARKLEANN